MAIKGEQRLNHGLALIRERLKGFEEKARLGAGLVAQFQSNVTAQAISLQQQRLDVGRKELLAQCQTYLVGREVDFKALLQSGAKTSWVNT